MATSFWSDPTIEPKRSFRFVLHIGGLPHWIVESVERPKLKIEPIPHYYLNHKFNYPGRATWTPVKVTLVDPVSPDAARTLYNIIEKSGYHVPVNGEDLSTLSKKNAVGAVGKVSIKVLGAEGETVEEWHLVNAWVSNYETGTLDYSKDEMLKITLEFTYDYAKVTGIGEIVPPANA